MPKIKAKFNADKILNSASNVHYPEDYLDMVRKHKDNVIEVEKEVFGGYELELEGSTWALYENELIILA